MTPVKVTTEIGSVKIVQDFETDQPVDQEAVKQAIVDALSHVGVRPKRTVQSKNSSTAVDE